MPEKKYFLPILPVASIGENFILRLFPVHYNYIVEVATFTILLAKIKSGKYFIQYTSASFGENFLPQNISTIRCRSE